MRKLCLLALLLLVAYAQAATYKWKDKDGNVQYGSNPPADIKAEAVGLSGAGGGNQSVGNIVSINDVDALPYLSKNPVSARKAYEKYLAAPQAKLFVACSDGQFFTIVKEASIYEVLYKYMQEQPGYNASRCHPYAFNNEVIWNRKR